MEQQFETQERNIVVTPQAERHLSKTAGWVLFMAVVSALLLFANVVVLVLLYFGLEPKFNYIELTILLLQYLGQESHKQPRQRRSGRCNGQQKALLETFHIVFDTVVCNCCCRLPFVLFLSRIARYFLITPIRY